MQYWMVVIIWIVSKSTLLLKAYQNFQKSLLLMLVVVIIEMFSCDSGRSGPNCQIPSLRLPVRNSDDIASEEGKCSCKVYPVTVSNSTLIPQIIMINVTILKKK